MDMTDTNPSAPANAGPDPHTVTVDDRSRWDEKYSDPEFRMPAYPIPELKRRIETLPDGRALDVATGSGRNAVYLAANGYTVDAIDISSQALSRAQQRATDQGVSVEWIQADLRTYPFPSATYDVITMSFFNIRRLLPKLKKALRPGGVLIVETHLRTSDPVDRGPDGDNGRVRANELLRGCLDLTVLAYEERRRRDAGRQSAVATIVARRSHGGRQSYPEVETVGSEKSA